MKLIKQESLLIMADFHGINIEVPENTWYLAASPRGMVTAWANGKPRPIEAHNGGFWWSGDDEDFLGEVAQVDLEGMDWKQSCICLV